MYVSLIFYNIGAGSCHVHPTVHLMCVCNKHYLCYLLNLIKFITGAITWRQTEYFGIDSLQYPWRSYWWEIKGWNRNYHARVWSEVCESTAQTSRVSGMSVRNEEPCTDRMWSSFLPRVPRSGLEEEETNLPTWQRRDQPRQHLPRQCLQERNPKSGGLLLIHDQWLWMDWSIEEFRG